MASQLIASREITEEPSEEPMVDITSPPTEHAESVKKGLRTQAREDEEEEDLLVPTSAQVEGPIASVSEDPVDPPAPSVLNGDEEDPAA
ncbi:hypothetical protein Bca52824_075482 [Brassica carinata]|uniref:Uncharacterized protein n=1 Tax=Brassica carinata TaxID=52824 RepID=A0A8X7PT50_BRACI|nr:hypothetical protein Bca52824_075482 [Brassica carinata]